MGFHDDVAGAGYGGEHLDGFAKFYKQSAGIDEDDEENILISERIDFPRMNKNIIDDFEYFSVDKFNQRYNEQANAEVNFSVLNLNIRGLECNFDKLVLFLNSIKHKFDVIVLNEAHLLDSPLTNSDMHIRYPLNGYDLFHVNSTIKYGGIVIYVKSRFQATYNHSLTKSDNSYDSLYVSIEVNKLMNCNNINKKLTIGGYYRHCLKGSADVMTFIDKFDDDLKHKSIAKHDVILAGDFNVCLLKSSHKTDSLCFLNTIIGNDYECTIFKPTRIQYHDNSMQVKSASLIDQVMTNMLTHEYTSGNLHYPDSDHHGTFIMFENYLDPECLDESDDGNLYKRRLNAIDENDLLNDFGQYDWDTLVYRELNLDKATENLVNSIEELCDKHAPLTKVSNRKIKYCHKPYIDRELLEQIRIKNRLYTTYQEHPSENNKIAFKELRNKVVSLLRKKKKAYFRSYFGKFRNNAKKMWDGINLALEQSRKKKTIPNYVTGTDGNLISGSKNLANAFAKYFKEIPSKTKSMIIPSRFSFKHYLRQTDPSDRYLTLYNTSNEEILKHLMKLKNNSSPGPIQVPNLFLKMIAKPLSAVLVDIINRSMTYGYVPRIFKIGKQTPVFKSGEVSVKNYRPITVCSNISKILEKVVRDRVIEYLKRIKLLNNSQFGFRAKHSTNHAIINLTETTLDGLESNLKVGGIFLDIAKAFDTVNFDILLTKLEHYGFRSTELMWFESYLKNREQYVSIKGDNSKCYTPEYGVPQGGTLAPILFIIFMNDIVHSSKVFNFSIYADDTCLILGIEKSMYDETIRTELAKIVDWFSSNELMLNISKTDYLQFRMHEKRTFLKGEHDMSDLHEVAPEYLFTPDYLHPHDEYICHKELNDKGEFILQDLHTICPAFVLEEYIEMPDGSTVHEPDYVKYLGVYFDNKLSFKRHIDITTCKISRLISVFWRSAHLTTETKKMVYHSLVQSQLNYGIIIWGSNLIKNVRGKFELDHVPKNLRSLNVAINKIVRAITRKPRFDKKTGCNTPSKPLYQELEILTLNNLYYYNLGILAHSFYYNHPLPEKITENLVRKSSVSSKRTKNNEFDLYYAVPTKDATFRKPTLACAVFWNKLPTDIKSTSSKTSFQNKLKFYLINL